jgi:hypothetical protein
MAQAYYESSCNPNARARGPYGMAAGLVQLHQGQERIYTSANFDRFCQNRPSSRAEFALQCGLATKFSFMERGQPTLSNESHWSVFRFPKTTSGQKKAYSRGRKGDKFENLIASIPDCQAHNLALYQKSDATSYAANEVSQHAIARRGSL